MYSFLEQNLTIPNRGIVVCVAPAPTISLDTFLLAPLSGEPMLWRSPTEAWSFAGFGVAARACATGPARFSKLQAEAQQIFQQLTVRAHPECQNLPPIRLFGGASFQAEKPSSPWQAFEEADFTLPRWCYAKAEGRAFLTLAFSPQEDLAQLQSEAKELDTFFTTPSHPSAPTSPSKFNIEEQTRQEWAALVQSALREMRAGSFEKVVLARCSYLRQEHPFTLSEMARRMLSSYQDCTQFIMGRRGASFVGSTPEKLVSVAAMQVEIDALAGSTPRVFGEEEQASLALLQNQKERREHQHVIQGIEDVLCPFAARLEKDEQPRVRMLPNVLHLHTSLKAKLSSPAHILSLVEALHPTPAVCGLPREAARTWIAANEPFSRGWYAAPVGHFDAQGEGAFFVAIRSALLEDNKAWIYAGAGLVEGSEPEKEYDETVAKQRPMLSALGVL
jgi:salicylate biosynthesis isochorismate synthase